MPLLYWLDIAALSISTVIAAALALMVLGAGLGRALNRSFALFTFVEATWAVLSLLLRLALWLELGNPLLLSELVALAFSMLGPLLLLFTVRYVDRRTRWTDAGVVLGLAAMALLCIPLFRHQLVFDPQLAANGATTLRIGSWGLVAALIPLVYQSWSLYLFWCEPASSDGSYLAASVLILLLGFVVGGVLNPPFPIASVTNTLSVILLGYAVASRQLFNPLREATAELERLVVQRTRELEVAYRQVETAYQEVEQRVRERTADLQREIAERKRTEEELQQSELRYRMTLEAMGDAIHVVDRDLHLILANPALEQWNEELGLQSDVLGLPVFEVFPFLPDEIRKEYHQVFESGATLVTEEWTEVAGREIATETRKIPVLRGDEVVAVITVLRDVTERKRGQWALEQYAERLRVLHEIDRAILEARSASDIAQAALEHVQHLVPCDWVSVMLFDFEAGEAQVLASIFNGETQLESGSRLPLADFGDVRGLREDRVRIAEEVDDLPPVMRVLHEAGVHSFIDVPLVSRGELIGSLNLAACESEAISSAHVAVAREVADQLAVAIQGARLLEAERRRIAELEALHRASLHLTASLELQPVLEAILRHTLELVPADNAHVFFYDGEELSFGAAMWAGGAERETYAEPRPQGLTYAVACSGERIVIPDVDEHPLFEGRRWGGAVVGLPLVVGDTVRGVMNVAYEGPHAFGRGELNVLDLLADQAAIAIHNARLYEQVRKQADDLAEALARQEELDRLQAEFVQNVSHELRSPLALVRGYAEMLDSGRLGALTADQRRPVSIIARRARMLSDLVADITLILESEVRPLKRAPLPLDELARTAAEDFRVAADEAGLSLEAEIADGVSPVSGSVSYLRRMIDNLLGNAIKFTPRGGAVTLRVWQEEDTIVLQVEDTGIGIPSDQLGRIFERFYQVNGSARRRYGGVGLGLALVKEIAELHDGSVEVESEVGQGSVFTVRLPAAESESVSLD